MGLCARGRENDPRLPTAFRFLPMHFYQFRLERFDAPGRKEGRKAGGGRSVLRRLISGLEISDIVKRKRIRSNRNTDDGRRRTDK